MCVNKKLFCALLAYIFVIHQQKVNCKAFASTTSAPEISLYTDKDEVEFLNKDNIMSLFNHERAAFVEFYSHWCGACQRYSKNWKEIANITKNWHSKVLRVAAINCADPKNHNTCVEFGITYFPTLKFIPAYAIYATKDHDARLVEREENSLLIKRAIDFIDSHTVKPPQWPQLSALKSKTINDLFLNKNAVKYALLVLENKDSYVGRKCILEFSSFTDRLIIYRLTEKSSPELYKKFNTNVDGSPFAYVINNDDKKTSRVFNKNFVDEFVAMNPLETGLIKTIADLDAGKKETNTDDIETNLMDLIHRFIQHLKADNSAVSKIPGVVTQLIEAEVSNQMEQSKNEQDKIFMQDLESGLSLMLRSDVAANKFFTKQKLYSLKEVVRVLSKYFPGRAPVKNYLVDLYDKIKNKTQITSNQWQYLVDQETPSSFLPSKVEWRYCKGSTNIYRGYPCSLWTIFHVLTVSQVEKERSKPKPFTGDFDVTEVINAIRLFVFNFFTCKECVQNFEMETADWESHLSYPYDAVKYLWEVHNSVNDRLKKEGNNDPMYPKDFFPTKVLCPKCYKDSNSLKAGESPFESKEVLAFLQLYYSKFRIEGAVDTNLKKSNDHDQSNVDHFNSGKNRELLDVQIPKQEHQFTSFDNFDDEKNNTIIQFSIFTIILTVIGLFIMFYGYNMKRERIKAHII